MLTIDRELSLIDLYNISRYFAQPGPMCTPLGRNKNLFSSKKKRFHISGCYRALIFNFTSEETSRNRRTERSHLCYIENTFDLFYMKEEIVLFGEHICYRDTVILYVSTFAGLLCASVIPRVWH